MIGMHPSLSSYAEKQRVRTHRREKNRAYRQEHREFEVRLQYQRAERNILNFMRKGDFKAIYGPSLQTIILELSKTQEVIHNIEQRKSGKKKPLDLLHRVVHGMIDGGRLTSYEEGGCAVLGIPHNDVTPQICDELVYGVDSLDDFNWHIPVIVNCSQPLRKVLAEYV